MRLDVVARAGPHSSATPTARPEHVTAGGAARGSTRIETGARYARQFRLVDRHTTTLVRGEQGCVRLAVIPQVSAPRDAQGVVHSGYTRRCRHDEVRALAPPFRRPRLPSIPLAFAPSRDPPAIVFRIRRISARPPTSAPLIFASPFPPSPGRFDLGAVASSNWRETAKTRARARSAEAELASANETIRTLQAKMMLVETKLGGEKRQLADEGAKLRDVIAEDTARHDARLDAAKRDHDARYDELAERHARARAELASLHSTLGRAAGGARGVTDLDTELQTEREAMHRDALERLEHTLRSEAAHAYETLEKAKDAQIKNLKEQSEYFLSAKDREIGELRRRADARERETTAETARLNAQVEYLHRWALAMNQIIRKVEDGSYRVAERAGARTLAIPARGGRKAWTYESSPIAPTPRARSSKRLEEVPMVPREARVPREEVPMMTRRTLSPRRTRGTRSS